MQAMLAVTTLSFRKNFNKNIHSNYALSQENFKRQQAELNCTLFIAAAGGMLSISSE